MLQRIYDWTMNWARSRYAVPALFTIALMESSFFPIPPDLLLIPMVLAQPSRGFVFAFWCTIGSVIGGALGYLIGAQFWQWVGTPIIEFYNVWDQYEALKSTFEANDILIIATAAFSPIPYKLFTITAGVVHSNFVTFMVTSIVARGARFFLVAGLLYWGGDRLRNMVERHLSLLTAVLMIAALLLFFGAKYLL
ncbi:MAG: DedA family protein [Magnetococcales bacterium]|nr:DedA family protein [Magnetococcales bacterium]